MKQELLPNGIRPFRFTINNIFYKGFYKLHWKVGEGNKAIVISHSHSKGFFPLNEWQLATHIDNELVKPLV